MFKYIKRNNLQTGSPLKIKRVIITIIIASISITIFCMDAMAQSGTRPSHTQSHLLSLAVTVSSYTRWRESLLPAWEVLKVKASSLSPPQTSC